MDEHKIMSECFLCKRPIQVGPHRYEGSRVPAWDIMVCDICRRANWDGIVPSTHPHLIRHLESRGIKIKLNAKGWLDIPS